MKTKLVLALGAIIILAGMMLNAASITGNPKSLTVGGINFAIAGAKIPDEKYSSSFGLENCTFSTTGSNPYFILEPGYQLVFEGEGDEGPVNVTSTVLNQTKVVGDGIVARVVEEKTVDAQTGDLIELTNDYFSICNETNTVVYLGEDVNDYENGKVVDHEGSWLHGSDNARYGLIMPGIILLGSKYYQEIAPEVAMDKAEVVGVNETVNVPAGSFSNVIHMKETSDLEPGVAAEENLHAPGVGQVIDGDTKLVKHGYLK
jgi:hypothetical protein